MRNYLKRIGALLLCLTLLIPAGGVFATDSDAVEHTLSYQLGTLNRLGLITNTLEDVDPAEAVTRVNFATAVARVYGIQVNEDATISDIAFDDMTDYSAEEIYAVKILADRGLVSGTGYRTFSPEETITQEQAAKILVSVLGHGFVAEQEGGYPAGYVARASRLGLFDGISFGGNVALSWNDFISMLYQALFADIMQPVYYAAEISYTVVQGENLLTNIMNLSRVRAEMVTATDKTALSGGEGVTEGYVEIGGVLYLDNGEAAQYLGKLVDVYFKSNRDGSRRILHIAPTYDQGAQKLNIHPELQLNGYEISYYDAKGNQRIAKIATDANMIYNGEILAYNPALIQPATGQGSILLQHSGSGSNFDLVVVDQYTNVIVKSVNADRNIVYDLRGGSLDLDAFVDNETCTIVKNGEELDVADLQEDQILHVYENASQTRITIEVRSDLVTGILEQTNRDTVTVAGNAYTFDSAIGADLQRNLGKTGTFYLTVDDKIIWVDWSGTEGLQYGYFLKGAMDGTFNTVLTLRVLTEKNTIADYDVAKHSTLKYQDGTETKATNASQVVAALQTGGAWKKQLVRYQLNDEGKIAVLCLADATTALPLGKHDVDFYCSVANTGEEYIYRSQNKTIGGRFVISAETPIFFVSPDNKEDEELYRCSSYSELENSKAYNFATYNANGGGLAGAVVCWKDVSDSISESSQMMLIDETVTGMNEDGSPNESLYGYVNGVYTEYHTEEPLIVQNIGRQLRCGDLIALSRNDEGIVTRVRLRVDVNQKLNDNPKLGAMNESNWGKAEHWGFAGAFYSIEDGYAMISRDCKPYLGDIFLANDLPSKLYALPLTGKIMIYDEETDSVKVGTVEDIVSYQEATEDATRAYFDMKLTAINNIYIYKFENQ